MGPHEQYGANIKFDNLLNEIRGKPDFENFLGPLRQEDTREAAQDGPLVVLSASEFRGVDAILVRTDGVRVLRFADASMERLEVRSRDLESLELLEWLWDAIVKRIMDTPRLIQPPPEKVSRGSGGFPWEY